MLIKVKYSEFKEIREDKQDYRLNDVPKVFRNAKDNLFTFLFRDITNLRKLYSVIADDNEKYRDEDFKILTLENVLVPSVYNDLGFLVGNQLIVLVEEQSSFNPNMAIRYLLYIAGTYQNYILDNKINIYGTKKVTFPEPKFYLVYTGKRAFDTTILKLSDSFNQKDKTNLELLVEVLTKEEVKDSILEEYMQFCELYDKYSKEEEHKLQALRRTMNHCIRHNILSDFLQSREREVEEMLMQLYNQEQMLDLALEEKFQDGIELGIEQGIEQGIERGLERGSQERAFAIARNMKKDNMPIALIMQYTGLSEEIVAKL